MTESHFTDEIHLFAHPVGATNTIAASSPLFLLD
jgi:hypothetical protein